LFVVPIRGFARFVASQSQHTIAEIKIALKEIFRGLFVVEMALFVHGLAFSRRRKRTGTAQSGNPAGSWLMIFQA
jgi:hypothetical protein